MSRLLSWLSTKNGKRLTHFCVGGVALAIFGSHIAVRGPMLDKVVNIFQVYRYGKPRPLPDKVNMLVQEVLDNCKLKDEEKKKLKFFYVIGHEMFHSGGIESPWGAVIGIPFTFEDPNDVNFGELRLHGREPIDWVIDGQDLLKALTLSESAKKFALMREIYSCNFSEILENAVIGALCFLIPAKFSHRMNRASNAFERLTLRQRNFRYLLFYSCGIVLYRLVKDPMKHLSDKNADRLAAETGPEYLDGGMEYYKKMLMKNKNLQDMSDSTFWWKKYDDKGNENFFILAPRMPTSKRLDNLREMKFGKIVKSGE